MSRPRVTTPHGAKRFDVQEDDFPGLQRRTWSEEAEASEGDDEFLAQLAALRVGETFTAERDGECAPAFTYTRVA